MGVVIFPERPIMVYSHPKNSKGYTKGCPGSKGNPVFTTLRGATITGCPIPPYSRASTRQSSRKSAQMVQEVNNSIMGGGGGDIPSLQLPPMSRGDTANSSGNRNSGNRNSGDNAMSFSRRPSTRHEFASERRLLKEENNLLKGEVERVRTAKQTSRSRSSLGLTGRKGLTDNPKELRATLNSLSRS